jgi:hypothetical protein
MRYKRFVFARRGRNTPKFERVYHRTSEGAPLRHRPSGDACAAPVQAHVSGVELRALWLDVRKQDVAFQALTRGALALRHGDRCEWPLRSYLHDDPDRPVLATSRLISDGRSSTRSRPHRLPSFIVESDLNGYVDVDDFFAGALVAARNLRQRDPNRRASEGPAIPAM